MYRKIMILLTIPLIGFGFTLIKNTFAQTVPALTLTASATEAEINDTITVTLDALGVENLGAYQVTFTYNPTLISVETASISSFLSSTGRTVGPVGPTINNTTGTATIGAFSFGTQAGPSGDGALATFTLKALSNGTVNLDLVNVSVTDTQGATINNLTLNPVTLTIGSATEPTPTAGPTPSLSPTVTPPSAGSSTLTLNGPNSVVLNQPATYELMLNTPTPVTGVDALITYDPQAVTITLVTDNHLLANTPANTAENGTIRFSAVANPNEPYTGNGSLASILLTPKTDGAITLTFTYTSGSKAESNVIEAATGTDILASPSSLTFTVVDQASLSLSLTTPSEDTATGHSLTGTLSQESGYSASVSANTAGITDPVDIDSSVIGTLQSYFFKANGYLREKIDLTVQSGLNTVTLGLLKAGDLNDDSVINSLDLSLMYDQWFTPGSADFNRDGMVNSADHWHLISNFLEEDE